VRHLEALRPARRTEVESHAPASDPAQSGALPLGAAIEQELHAEADPEHRRSIAEDLVRQRLDQAELGEVGHSGVERADTGQDELVRGQNLVAPGRQLRLEPGPLEHVDDGGQVAHLVVDDSDHRHAEHSLP
jgi:hypothetical protein